jgi:hypothetical protein
VLWLGLRKPTFHLKINTAECIVLCARCALYYNGRRVIVNHQMREQILSVFCLKQSTKEAVRMF